MSTEPSPLKYMGTQSRETVNMAAAMAHAVQIGFDRGVATSVGRADDALIDGTDAGG